MAGDKLVRRVAVAMLTPALGQHEFFLRFQHWEPPDLFEVPGKADFACYDSQGSSWGHDSALHIRAPAERRADGAVALRADGARSIISHPQHTRSNQPSGRETASLRRDASLIFAQMALKTRRILSAAGLLTASAGPTPGQRIMQTGKIRRQFRSELKDFAS